MISKTVTLSRVKGIYGHLVSNAAEILTGSVMSQTTCSTFSLAVLGVPKGTRIWCFNRKSNRLLSAIFPTCNWVRSLVLHQNNTPIIVYGWFDWWFFDNNPMILFAWWSNEIQNLMGQTNKCISCLLYLSFHTCQFVYSICNLMLVGDAI